VFKHFLKKIARPKRILFYRDFQTFSGGHQKVADYYAHLAASDAFDPAISFSESTQWDTSNPWLGIDKVEYLPAEYDYVFLAGMDWQKYLSVKRPSNQPVINFIQHVRHADPTQNVFPYLIQRAIRICVSPQVAGAIEATGKVNGPIVTIPNGVQLPELNSIKTYDVVILGIKQPQLASDIDEQLAPTGLRILVINQQVPREQWFEYLSMSRIAILLPNPTEGFYLPALEAMHYCDLVIVPDCIGNRDFCRDGKNCLMPTYNPEAILTSTMHALALLQNKHVLTEFKREMRETLRTHSLANERRAFLELMDNVRTLWKK
jgi:glycosyltransferase involved in cell wall biosynthesis